MTTVDWTELLKFLAPVSVAVLLWAAQYINTQRETLKRKNAARIYNDEIAAREQDEDLKRQAFIRQVAENLQQQSDEQARQLKSVRDDCAKQINDVKLELAEVSAYYEDKTKDFNKATSKVSVLSSQVSGLTSDVKRLSEQNESLLQANKSLTEQHEADGAALTAERAEKGTLLSKVQELEQQVESLQRQVESLQKQVTASNGASSPDGELKEVANEPPVKPTS